MTAKVTADKGAEWQRLEAARDSQVPWRKWGPYLSERQWGTVREDYSESGDAWNYFTHDQARSRAYRWGEDGLGGYFRRPATAVFRAGALERQGPDSQGAAVWSDQQRGEPRRGRQGVLLLSRLDADPLVHEVSLQVSAVGVSVCRSRSGRIASEVATRFECELLDTGVFDERSILRRLRRVRESRGGRRAGPDHRAQSRARGRDAFTSCRRSGFGTSGLASTPSERPSLRQKDGGRHCRDRIRTSANGFSRPRARRSWLFTENETNTERFDAGANAVATSKTVSTTSSFTVGRTR